MSSPDAERRDELLARLMVDYDEALATNASLARIEESVVGLDPQLAADWEVEKHWLEVLNQARRTDLVAVSDGGPPSPPPAPQRLGRFLLERELGRGGLGIVYLARDPRLGRWVALKVPRGEKFLEDDLRRRFIREAEAAARLNHPNVVALYEVGEDGAVCYLASEYCAGPTLAEWLRARRQPVEFRQAAVLILTLAEAVQHAHSRGVLHRDIKPSNVLMELAGAAGDDDCWSPKLTDFGMAKLLEQASDDRTRTGAIIGTVAYMAPEQAEGRVTELDNRADVYGLGAILYELLAGVPPYRGQTDIDTLRQLIAAEPALPHQLRPNVPRDLEAIALKCLARHPAARYQTAADLAQDLRRYLAGEPTTARPAGWLERAAKWSRRHPAACVGIAVSTVALLVLSAGGWIATGRTRAALNLAEERRQRAEQSEAAAAASELASRRLLYASELSRAAVAWESNEPELARKILEHQIPAAGQADLREFGWRCLWAKTHEEEHVLAGHTADVFCIRYSADGTLLASASKDHCVGLWDARRGVLLAKLAGHTSEVTALSFLPGDRQVVSVGEDGRLLLWDVTSHQLVRELFQGPHELYTLALSSDGRFLATAGLGADIRVFRTEDWQPLAEIRGAWQSVHALQFSAAGGWLLSGSDDGPIRVWRTDTGGLLGTLEGHPSCVRGLVLCDHDRRLVSVGREDGTVRIWDLPPWDDAHPTTVQPLRTTPPSDDWLQAVAVCPGEESAIVAARNGSVAQLQLETATRERTLNGHEGRVWSVCYSPDGEHVATAGADQTIRIWPVHNGCFQARSKLSAFIGGVFLDSQGSPVALGMEPQRGVAIDIHTRAVIDELTFRPQGPGDVGRPNTSEPRPAPETDSEVAAIAVAQTAGMWAAGSHRNEMIRIGSLRDHTELAPVGPLGFVIASLALSTDGRRLAVSSDRGALQVWDVRANQPIAACDPGDEVMPPLSFSPDGARLAFCRQPGSLFIWDYAQAPPRQLEQTASEDCNALTFSPDGQTLATSNGDRAIGLWDVASGHELGTLTGQRTKVWSLAFSPDGRTLATGGDHGLITLWDLATHQRMYDLNGPWPRVYGVHFGADGQSLVCFSGYELHSFSAVNGPHALGRPH